MSILLFLITSLITAGSVVYLITYIPIISTIFGKAYSPRLIFLKFLPLIDVVLSLSMIVIPMFTGFTGIGVFVVSAFTAAGLTGGVIFVLKVMKPRWINQYNEKKANISTVIRCGNFVTN